jgi:hypothetical protein
MPAQKDFKRLVRARMKKTGESYTAARARLLAKKPAPRNARPSSKPIPQAPTHAEIAGVSDASVALRTGKTWAEWVRALDAAGAVEWPHREIARHVHDAHDGVSGWWAQTVTVGYERIRGLRDVGQRRGGGYEVSKTKTVPVAVGRLYEAFAVARSRRVWLPHALTIRTSRRARSMRAVWPDGTRVSLTFLDKGPAKSAVAVQHGGLATRDDADRLRSFWGERLEALARWLG